VPKSAESLCPPAEFSALGETAPVSRPSFSTGLGTDLHRFSESARGLWLYGVYWSDQPALIGHSDADAGIHSIIDALLAAAGLGDIGENFGVNRPETENIASLKLLDLTVAKLKALDYRICSVSSQVIADFPRLQSRKTEILNTLQPHLPQAQINVSGKTSDHVFGEKWCGVFAISTVLIQKNH
jgi:2-C-methyl-D-erythritol 4-phosphate cytidylyltransferase/2-C-methyl-D-erythritol 2,4-cyclodiphosphate synthase